MKTINLIHPDKRPLFLLLLIGMLPLTAHAQLPTADLRQLRPFSAPAGKKVEVSIIGSNLDNASEIRFSHPGITAKPVMLAADEFHSEPRTQSSRFQVSVAPDVPPGIYEARVVSYFGLSTARPGGIIGTTHRLPPGRSDCRLRFTRTRGYPQPGLVWT